MEAKGVILYRSSYCQGCIFRIPPRENLVCFVVVDFIGFVELYCITNALIYQVRIFSVLCNT
jgi:hypothetical protein